MHAWAHKNRHIGYTRQVVKAGTTLHSPIKIQQLEETQLQQPQPAALSVTFLLANTADLDGLEVVQLVERARKR
jgi:hypothetical protein